MLAAYPKLDRLHAVIQAAMGWQDHHLHAFRVGGVSYGPLDPDDELGHLDERKLRLGDLTADRIAAPPGAEREEMLEWAGGEYDPSRFDLAAASGAVAGI